MLFHRVDVDTSGDLLDAFFEVVFRFVVLLGLTLACGLVGLVGVGALIGSTLRRAAAPPAP